MYKQMHFDEKSDYFIRLKKIGVETKPTDIISLGKGCEAKVRQLWMKPGQNEPQIPSDIFFAGTIPIEILQISSSINSLTDGCIVCVHEQYKRVINESKNDEYIWVGYVNYCVPSNIGWPKKAGIIVPICVKKGSDQIYISHEISGYAYDKKGNDCTEKFLSIMQQFSKDEDLCEDILNVLATWYGIQIALLHPTIKDVFKNVKNEPVYDLDNTGKSKKANKKKPIKYIKRHIVNANDFDKALHQRINKNERHTFVWYVIGHWRKYKNGKQLFIQPYWKGPLRNTKENAEPRQREIVI